MKSPNELLDTLGRYEDTGSAIAVYKEAAGYIKAYREVQQQALECARAEMEGDGVAHHKDNTGSAGWSKPKALRLDREKWARVLEASPDLQQLQADLDRAQARLEEAQQETGCLYTPEPRFYIR